MRFNAKIAVVTGASGGLGSLYSQMSAREGARVVAVDRAAEGVQKTAALIREAGGACLPVTAGPTESARLEKIMAS